MSENNSKKSSPEDEPLKKARGLLSDGRVADAIEAFRKVIYEFPNLGRAMWGLADSLTADGQHACAVLWYRRALERRPDSDKIRQGLAETLLRREHWAEGRELIRQPEGRDGIDVPPWDGKPLKKGTLLAYLRPGDSLELTLIGLGTVKRLADEGYSIACECPAPFAKLVESWVPKVDVLKAGSKKAASRLAAKGFAAKGFAAGAPLAGLALVPGHEPAPLPYWLTNDPPKKDDKADAIRTLGVLCRSEESAQAILDDRLMGELEGLLDATMSVIDNNLDDRSSTDRLAKAIAKTDAVVTDDGAAALLAGAIGRPVLFLLPPDAPWWWGDRKGGCVWYPRLRLLRVGRGTVPRDTARSIAYEVDRNLEAPRLTTPLRPNKGDRNLIEILDRVSPYIGNVDGATVEATVLKGGTHNDIYRISCPGEDRVLRLGSFPPEKKPSTRVVEMANMVTASKAGLTSRLYFSDPLDGTMVSQFLDGTLMSTRMMKKKGFAVSTAHLFRRLHALPTFQGEYDIFGKLTRMKKRLIDKKSAPFHEQERYNKLVERFGEILTANGVPHCPTHNDPQRKNFIATDDGLFMIDWELSGMSDPHWEVASLSSEVGMSEDVRNAYLTEYFGSEDHPALCRIPLYESLCHYYWWLDALRDGVNDPDGSSWREEMEENWRNFREVVDTKRFDHNREAAEKYRWSRLDDLPG